MLLHANAKLGLAGRVGVDRYGPRDRGQKTTRRFPSQQGQKQHHRHHEKEPTHHIVRKG
jgi:hypothetical protein